MENKKALSPVIATVLLIAIVVVIAVIIFLWFRGFTEEAITKFGNKNIKLVCGDIKFQASYSAGTLSISNTGIVPIYNINMKISGGGSFATQGLKELDIGWPAVGLNQGEAFSANIASQVADKEEIILIPILVGKSKKGEKTFECEERYGYKINI